MEITRQNTLGFVGKCRVLTKPTDWKLIENNLLAIEIAILQEYPKVLDQTKPRFNHFI
jgi:hypothetical protein